MATKLFALCLLAFRVAEATESNKSGQAPNEAFVDKLKALAAQLGSNAATATPAAISGSTQSKPAATATAATPAAVDAPPPAVHTLTTVAPVQLEASTSVGNPGFMKSLDTLKLMLGAHTTAAVATQTPVVGAPSSQEPGSGIEQQLKALKKLLQPSPSNNVAMVANTTQSMAEPTKAVAATSSAAVATGVVATSTASKDDDKDDEDDKDEDDDVDTMVNKMVKSTNNPRNVALKSRGSGAATNAQRVAKMAKQYIKHIPSHTMLNKRRQHPDPIRP